MPDTLPALIFDFDGTLIESAPELARCLNTLLAAYDRPPVTLAQEEHMIGNGVAKLVGDLEFQVLQDLPRAHQQQLMVPDAGTLVLKLPVT